MSIADAYDKKVMNACKDGGGHTCYGPLNVNLVPELTLVRKLLSDATRECQKKPECAASVKDTSEKIENAYSNANKAKRPCKSIGGHQCPDLVQKADKSIKEADESVAELLKVCEDSEIDTNNQIEGIGLCAKDLAETGLALKMVLNGLSQSSIDCKVSSSSTKC